jgi:hypothetical protein
MVYYRRNFLPGGTFFFTVTLPTVDRARLSKTSRYCGALFARRGTNARFRLKQSSFCRITCMSS